MTWEPTHVQFTVLRARNLVGKIKGKTSAKITDVFVTINLGREKFQTSTIKYGGKVKNSVEWFEECDLMIPEMSQDVEVHVMNRGLLSDEFIGYASVPLANFDVYDRPKSQWVTLIQKPSKLPDGRCRGELEVRLTFHVKSRNDGEASAGLKGKRTGSIKSLVSGIGDKLKFSRSRSLRGDGNQVFSSPNSSKPFKTMATKPYQGEIVGDNSAVKFDAVDLYVPEQCWRENEVEDDLGDGNFARSYSLTIDKRRNNRDFKSRSLMNLPGEQSMTLPSRGRNKHRPSLDDSALNQSYRSSRSSRSSVTSQEGYLESMFKKECEVDDRMNDVHNEYIEEESEGEYDNPQRRSAARAYDESASGRSRSGSGSRSQSGSGSRSGSSRSSSSHSDSEEEITLPKVRLKNRGSGSGSMGGGSQRNSLVDGGEQTQYLGTPIDELDGPDGADGASSRGDHSVHSGHSAISGAPSIGSNSNAEINNDEAFDVFGPSEYTSELDRIIARENSRTKSVTLNSQGNSDGHTSTHTSSSSLSYQGKTAAQRAYERGSTDSMSGSRRPISPPEDFSFTSQASNDDSTRSQPRRRTKPYVKEGRRYTVSGLECMPSHRSAPDIRDQRPVYREESVPEDLMAVYRNMNRDELVRLVVTHKAQLIRKDQYIRELEAYIDNLLVRVMETSPRILQNL